MIFYRLLALLACKAIWCAFSLYPLADGFDWHQLAFCLVALVLFIGAFVANQCKHYALFPLFLIVSSVTSVTL